jgi:hypothetical protein
MDRLNSMSNFYSPEREELCSYANLLVPTKFIGTIANFFEDPTMLSSVKFSASGSTFVLAELMYSFLLVLDRVSTRLRNREKEKLEEYYSNNIITLFRERTNTVLPVAIDNFRVSLTPVRLILILGAGVTTTDENRQTALYNLAASGRYFSDGIVSLFKMLLDGDDHLDAVSENGRTVISVVKGGLRVCENNGQIDDDH